MDWQRVWALFEEALERPEDERLGWLAGTAGPDTETRRQVERLLAAHGVSGSLLDQPVSPFAAAALEPAPESDGVPTEAGPYRILGEIGRGGMGVVYKAEDPRLGRHVALKFLPPHLVANDKAKQRFVREAQAASRLDHPNICTIHDLGQTGDGRLFFAMAYYEGQTVAERIASGPLPVAEAVAIARQVTRGLEYAHRMGVIHRDIKPSNILLPAEGEAKILDFGLARPPMSRLSVSALRMGTVPYMSPQQARGEPVDHRTDLWSLGVMLYEMTSGSLPFNGKTELELLQAIVHGEPAPLPAATPKPLRRLVARLLQKNPDARCGGAAEVAQALDNIQAPRSSPKAVWYVAAFAAVAVLVVVSGMWIGLWGPGAQPGGSGLQVKPFTAYPGIEWGAAFSPRGDRVAFSWNGMKQDNYDIYVKPAGAAGPERLTRHPAMDGSPAWSPDGQSIAFLRERSDGSSELLFTPSTGGPEEQIAIVDASPWMGLSWSADGRYFAVPDRSGPDSRPVVTLITWPGGQSKVLAEAPPGAIEVRNPAFSPYGSILAFECLYSSWRGDIRLVSTAGGSPRLLANLEGLPQGLAWMPNGRDVVFAQLAGGRRSLWRAQSAGGRPYPIPAGANPSYPAVNGARLLFTERASLHDIVRIAAGPGETGRPMVFIASSRYDGNPRYSPDGSAIAFASSRSGQAAIWVCDADGSNPRQLTSMNLASSPMWSPDSRRVAFAAPTRDHADLYALSLPDGSPYRITADPAENILPSFSRDGRWLYYTSNRSGRLEVWKLPSDARDDKGERAIQVTRGGGLFPIESADGRFVYYAKEQREWTSIWRVPAGGGPEKAVIVGLAAGWGAWDVSADGIYFVTRGDAAAGEGWALRFYSFATKAVADLAGLPKPPSLDGPALSVSPDGKWILCVQSESTGDLAMVEDFR
ncbi:MAG: PD40 domain-containing protein [Bryobacteraceae bacterium]|nr:PD40 domain-containing protein [Bryobacteraceae bacterium]